MDRQTSLTFDYLRDLISDIRTARKHKLEYPQYRDNQEIIEADSIREFRKLWTKRHGARIGRFGIPEV